MDRLSQYIDTYGLVQPDGKTSQNGIRFTSEYMLFEQLLFEAGLGRTKLQLHTLFNTFRVSIERCRSSLSFVRYPDTVEECSLDDYVGLITFSALHPESRFADWFLKTARSNDWKLGDVFVGRFLSLIAHAKIANGESLRIIDWIGWVGGIAITARFSRHWNADDWMLSIHLLEVERIKQRSGIGMIMRQIFYSRMRAVYGKQTPLDHYGFNDHPTNDLMKLWLKTRDE